MWETSEKKKSDDGEGEQRCKALQHVGAKLGMQFEVEVHKKKTNRACRNVVARWTMTLVSNCDFAIMIARMGFAHGRSIA